MNVASLSLFSAVIYWVFVVQKEQMAMHTVRPETLRTCNCQHNKAKLKLGSQHAILRLKDV